MKRKNIKAWSLIVAFAAIITAPIFLIHWTGGDYSEAEKRNLAPKPIIFSEDGSINRNVMSETKSWLEDHIGFRDKFIKLSAGIKYYLFGQSPSDQVHIGEDGWLYYVPDNNLKIATGDYPLDEDMLEKILQEHLAIRDELAEQGIDYVIVLPTSKVSIYPEHLRYGDDQVRKSPVDVVADYIEDNSDLHVIRLKDALLKEKDNYQLYFKTDTHWNQRGAYIAYKEIIDKMKNWGLCDTNCAEVRFENTKYKGEFGAMMGIDLPAEDTENSVILHQKAMKDEKSNQYKRFHELLVTEEIGTPCYYYQNSSVPSNKVMLYGDSMFGGWNLTDLFAENFSEFTYIWDRSIRPSLIDEIHPDVVVYELTERFLNLFTDQNRQMVAETLQDYQDQIEWADIQDGVLTVKVKNTSSSKWCWMDQIKLGIFIDEADSGIRAYLSANEIIEPGNDAIFTIDLDECSTLQGKEISVQMLQEGVCYFGEKKQIDIIG